MAEDATGHAKSSAGETKESVPEEAKHAGEEAKEEAEDETGVKESGVDSVGKKEAEEETQNAGEQDVDHAECAAQSEDCRQSRCCKDKKMRCFEKDAKWAACEVECVPGKHASDPKKYQDPWTCNVLAKDTGDGKDCTDIPGWTDIQGAVCLWYSQR